MPMDLKLEATIERARMGLMTPDELAALIDIRPSTLATWRYKNVGPQYVKLGKQIFYRRVDVDLWIKDQLISTDTKMSVDAQDGQYELTLGENAEGEEQMQFTKVEPTA